MLSRAVGEASPPAMSGHFELLHPKNVARRASFARTATQPQAGEEFTSDRRQVLCSGRLQPAGSVAIRPAEAGRYTQHVIRQAYCEGWVAGAARARILRSAQDDGSLDRSITFSPAAFPT